MDRLAGWPAGFSKSAGSALLLALLLLPLCGCFTTSMQPLYSPGAESFDKDLLGVWKSGDETVVFTQDPSGYNALYQNGGTAAAYKVHLVEIAKVQYLDVYPADAERKSAEAHYVPTHSIWRVSVEHSQLRLRAMKEEWLQAQMQRGGLSIAAVRVENDVVLLASTLELQEFVRANTDDLFPEGSESIWERQ